MKLQNWNLKNAFETIKDLHPQSAPYKNELINFEKKLYGKNSFTFAPWSLFEASGGDLVISS